MAIDTQKLTELNQLLKDGVITQKEFDTQKKSIMDMDQKANRKWFAKKRIIIPAVLVFLVVFGSIVGSGSDKKTVAPITPLTSTPPQSQNITKTVVEPKKDDKPKSKVTLASFGEIKTGNSLEEVEAILGKGELMSESEIGGYKSEMYTYKGDSFSNVTISFSNGKVMSKAQFGLK